MEQLIIQNLQKGDNLFSLEKDRRSGYPVFDIAKVLKVGETKPIPASNLIPGKEGFVTSTEIQVQDSVSQLTIYLPSNGSEGIYNGIYYTTNLENIINELNLQKEQALNILNNTSKYEAIVTECDNILKDLNAHLHGQTVNTTSIESFNKRLDDQEALLLRIAKELGLGEDKKE